MIRCTQCGARKNRTTDPCIYCGANAERQSSPKSKAKVFLLAILIITLVATSVLLLTGIFNPDRENIEQLAYTWISAVNEDDPEKLSPIFPTIYLDGTNVIPDFAADYLYDFRDNMEKEFGNDFHMSATIQSIESEDEEDENLMAILYEEADIDVSKTKTVEVELIISGSQKSESEIINLSIIKVDDNWYFDVLDSYFLDF